MLISRNNLLLDYLVNQMSQLGWPSTAYASNGSNSNYVDKYGSANVNQLAIQFFDYVRCTNLYDGILARGNDGWDSRGQNAYTFREQDTHYTFTSARVSPKPGAVDVSGDISGTNLSNTTTGTPSNQGTMLPGHGQVSPAIWSKGGTSYKGFGRMITISEIGFQFICTADGSHDAVAASINNPNYNAILGGVQSDNAGGLRGVFNPVAQGLHPEGLGGMVAERHQTNNTDDTQQNPKPFPMNFFYPYLNTVTTPGVYWSNFPPLNAGASKLEIDYYMSVYGCQAGGRSPNAAYHPSRHPGFHPSNWNMTLPVATLPDPNNPNMSAWLRPGQRRVQVLLLLELFCPSLGYTGFNPEWTVVLDGSKIAQMKLTDADGRAQPLFNTAGDIPVKSTSGSYGGDFAHPVGGHASPSGVIGGRFTRTISNSGGQVLMPRDNQYSDANVSGHGATGNYAFTSDFITVNSGPGAKLQVEFPGGDIDVKIYDSHNYRNPIQTLKVNFSQLPRELPVPTLAPSSRFSQTTSASTGQLTYTRALPGPHYWTANYLGCIGVLDGTVRTDYNGTTQPVLFSSIEKTNIAAANNQPGQRDQQSVRGRLSNESAAPGYTNNDDATYIANGVSIINEHDTVVSIVPTMGDYRILAARYVAPSSWWVPHPLANSGTSLAHSFTGFWASQEPGCKLAQSTVGTSYTFDPSMQIVGGARYDLTSLQGQYLVNNVPAVNPHQPDLPPSASFAQAANAYGDFDTGIATAREGPYINKPDEGNFFVGQEVRTGGTKNWRTAYFFNSWQQADDWRSGISMTPNRMISSPVMFGSLPTGVWDKSGGDGYTPWQTLLFRPHTQYNLFDPGSQSVHPGMVDPSDHYLLDLFFMPVVEPYAISEPLSVAGRINMNYQIMPFTNIRRATGMHALMKGEFVTAIPFNQINAAKEYVPNQAVWSDRFWDDKNDKRYWHRPIDVPATLRQFDLKFSHKAGGQDAYQGLFRSASQICDMHLVPVIKSDGSNIINPDASIKKASSQSQINNVMNTFWASNRPTGDNVRERPYSHLYARLTTRSNTFRVHVRAQVLKKARSTDPTVFVPNQDAVLSEYRGSTLLERYIDPNDSNVVIPDYAQGSVTGQAPLDSFFRFHALETKRFNP